MKVMDFTQCVREFNWLSVSFILIIAGLIDYFIGVQKDKKIMIKFQNELNSLHEIESKVDRIRKDIENRRL